MRPRDWTLLVLSAAEGRSLSPVQLQKAVFLLGQVLKNSSPGIEFYEFIPYYFGPFCARVYADARELAAEGLAFISPSPAGGWVEYGATQEGLARGKELQRKLDPGILRQLNRIVDWVRSHSFAEIVTAIYEKYPEYRVNSIFR